MYSCSIKLPESIQLSGSLFSCILLIKMECIGKQPMNCVRGWHVVWKQGEYTVNWVWHKTVSKYRYIPTGDDQWCCLCSKTALQDQICLILFDWTFVLFPKWILPNLPNSLNHDKILKWYGHQRYYLSGYRYIPRNNSRMYIFLIACEHVSPLTTLDRCVRRGSSRIFFCYSIWEYIYCLTWGISDNHLTIRLCRDSLVSTLHSVWQTIYDAKFGPVWGICLSKSYTTGYSGLPRIPSPHFPTHRTSCGGLQNFGPENTTPPSKNWDCSWMKLQSRIAPPPNWDVSWRTFCHGLVCRDYPRGYTSRSMEWFQ